MLTCGTDFFKVHMITELLKNNLFADEPFEGIFEPSSKYNKLIDYEAS